MLRLYIERNIDRKKQIHCIEYPNWDSPQNEKFKWVPPCKIICKTPTHYLDELGVVYCNSYLRKVLRDPKN